MTPRRDSQLDSQPGVFLNKINAVWDKKPNIYMVENIGFFSQLDPKNPAESLEVPESLPTENRPGFRLHSEAGCLNSSMRIIDIIESEPALGGAPPPSATPTSTQGYAGMVRQAVSAEPSPSNPYQGLGQLVATPSDLAGTEPAMTAGAPPVPDEQPVEASPAMRDLPPLSPATTAYESADWTMTFRDFLALYEAEKARVNEQHPSAPPGSADQ